MESRTSANRGALCISIDLELAWGVWDAVTPQYIAKCVALERPIVRQILGQFERHAIEATWAIVARLLTPSASADSEAWCAPDLVEAIRAASPRQEIGSHTFSHIYFDKAGREAVRDDLEAAAQIHREHGLDFNTFVFPRNSIAYLEELTRVGIKVFRGMDLGWQTRLAPLGDAPRRLANLADKIVPVPPSLVRPRRHPGGLVELPASMLLMGRNGPRRLIHPKALETKAALGLRAAARTGGIFHLWFHPSNFYYDTDVQLSVLDAILSRACRLRDRGVLDVRPMGSFARVFD
jgi:peptidoglycan/xylan/chitin deacetylase (PgdA/CDA1 family)